MQKHGAGRNLRAHRLKDICLVVYLGLIGYSPRFGTIHQAELVPSMTGRGAEDWVFDTNC